MFYTLYLLLFCCFFFLIILFPSQSFDGACAGLVLWFQTVIPTLLPFSILSNILIQSNGIHLITKRISFIFQKLFHISSSGSYAVLVGFLCGYPMGAKTISDLVKSHVISKNEGQYLLSFCNNTSPMFIISYLVLQNFADSSLTLPCIFVLLGTPILCSFFFRKYHKINEWASQKPSTSVNKLTFDFSILDQSIMNGFETLTRVGGYIILFSIIFSLSQNLPIPILVSFLEITNGIPFLLSLPLPYEIHFSLCLALVSFGGLCSIVQTKSMIQDSGLSIRPYIKEKLITAMVTSFIAYIYILFIRS